MGDSGEGLIDAEARILERQEEIERERARSKGGKAVRDPERVRAFESLRLARTELDRQRSVTANAARRAQLDQAIAEIDRRMADLGE